MIIEWEGYVFPDEVFSIRIKGIQLGYEGSDPLSYQDGICHVLRDRIVIAPKNQPAWDISGLEFMLRDIGVRSQDYPAAGDWDGCFYGIDIFDTSGYKTLCCHNREGRDRLFKVIWNLK
jgi:hypothetical protein